MRAHTLPETMTRRCSHCSNNGHNLRTCPARSDGGVRLFGVRLTTALVPAAMKKSASMSCIATSLGGGSGGSSPPAGGVGGGRGGDGGAGYVSDDPGHASCSTNGRVERKKGEAFFNMVRFVWFAHALRLSEALLISQMRFSINCGHVLP